jgi:apoptotic chromatin condensation inducer in the nucleus
LQYETDADAKKAFDNIHGVVFPKDTGKTLTVGGLTPEQVEKLIEHEQAAAERRLRVDWEPLIQKVKNGESLPPSPGSDNFRKPRSVGMDQIARQLAQGMLL